MRSAIRTVLFLFVISAFQTLAAQDLEPQTVKELVTSRRFVFTPQSVSPMSGGIRQVTPEFSLRVTADSIISYLPYFGRAFGIPPSEGGISFTSTRFEYNAKERKKKRWEISIRPKDNRDVQQMNFTLFDNGYGSLYVTSNNRQGITYYGYISKIN